jgi:hypothetical protein
MDEYLWTHQLHLQYHASNSSSMDEWHVLSLGMKKNNVSFLRDEKEIMSLSLVMIFQFVYYKKWSSHFAFLVLHFILLYPSDTHQRKKVNSARTLCRVCVMNGAFLPELSACLRQSQVVLASGTKCLLEAESSGACFRNAPFITHYPTLKWTMSIIMREERACGWFGWELDGSWDWEFMFC